MLYPATNNHKIQQIDLCRMVNVNKHYLAASCSYISVIRTVAEC